MTLVKRIRAALLQNVGLKIVSFGAALLVYSTVHGAQEAQRTIVVDIVGLAPPSTANRVLVSPLPARARVTIRGPKNMVNDLHSDDLGALQVDMRKATDTRVEMTPALVHVPTGVTVEQIDPPWLDLVWEERITRDVPVQVSVVGTPASAYMVKGAPFAEPSMVRVSGPKSEVLVLQHLRAEGFDVSGLTEGRHTRLLSIDRPPGRVELESRSVQVFADVAREISERPFPRLKVAIVGQPRAKSSPAEVDVHLSCPPEQLRSLRAEQLVPRVTVDSQEKTGSVLLPVLVEVQHCEATVTPSEVVVRW
ncbi:MAG: YbbR-like domain-containing protein [Proteobacteria bacterium]|nr:MAG: YbbR-like domain-containing protein [Pseudomonadota bacterium]